jgi:tetratricopeptide (TPR) repeat protein
MSAPGAFDKARAMAAIGDTAQALAALDAILDEESDHLGALLLKAALLMETRAADAALAVYERAARIWPRSSEALNELARCLHAHDRNDEAMDVARQAQALLGEGDNFRHTGSVYLTLVWILRAKRRFREALAVAEEGLERSPDAVLAEWASVVEQELAESEKERC